MMLAPAAATASSDLSKNTAIAVHATALYKPPASRGRADERVEDASSRRWTLRLTSGARAPQDAGS